MNRPPPRSPSRPGSRRPWRPRSAEPTTLDALLPGVVARMGGAQRGLEQRVFIAYADAVGPELARRSRPDVLKGTTLFIRVESSAFAHELTLLRQRIIERMAASLGEELVTTFRTRVGPLD